MSPRTPESIIKRCPLLEEALKVDNSKKPIKHHVTFDPDKTIVHRYIDPPLVPKTGGIKRLLPIKREKVEPLPEAKPEMEPYVEDSEVFAKPHALSKITGDKIKKKKIESRLIRKLFNKGRKRKFWGHRQQFVDENVDVHSNRQFNFTGKSYLQKVRNICVETPRSYVKDEVPVERPLVEVPEQEAVVSSPYYITEGGEKIKLVQMRREEIINCVCGFSEEDGLMMQCELCLCWQHANCHGIERESEVPDKYICHICKNPYNARASQKYLADQDWLLEGKLPSCEFTSTYAQRQRNRQAEIKEGHELTGNLLELVPVVHSIKCKIDMASKPKHPKFYYWAKSWTPTSQNIKIPERRISINTKPAQIKIEDSPTENKNLHLLKPDYLYFNNANNNLEDVPFINSTETTKPVEQDLMKKDSTLAKEVKPDDFSSLAKSDVFSAIDPNVINDISALLEAKNLIPTDSELVSILEGEMKSENDIGNDLVSELKLNDTLDDDENKNEPPLNIDLLEFMEEGKLTALSKTKEFDFFTSSMLTDAELAVQPNDLLVSNVGPQPEDLIDNDQCRWNLLEHIDDYQDKIEARLESLNERLNLLISMSTKDSSQTLKCSQMISLLLRDMETLNEICDIPDDEPEKKVPIHVENKK